MSITKSKDPTWGDTMATACMITMVLLLVVPLTKFAFTYVPYDGAPAELLIWIFCMKVGGVAAFTVCVFGYGFITGRYWQTIRHDAE